MAGWICGACLAGVLMALAGRAAINAWADRFFKEWRF